jgi:hypothetical protein
MQVGDIDPPDCGRREPVTHIRRYWRALRRGMCNEPHLDFRQLELKSVGVAGRLSDSNDLMVREIETRRRYVVVTAVSQSGV